MADTPPKRRRKVIDLTPDDDATWRTARKLAIDSGESLSQWIMQAIRLRIQTEDAAKKKKEKR